MFIILAAIAVLVMFFVRVLLPSGNKPDTGVSLRPKAVLKNYFMVSRNSQFLIYTLAGGLAMAGPFAYIVASSDIYMNVYHLTEQQYGWAFAIVAIGMIGTTQTNHFLLRHYRSETLIKVALVYQVTVASLLLTGVSLNWLGIYEFTFLVFLYVAGHGIMTPNITALAMAPFSKNAGSASALLGSFRLGASALVSALVSIFHDGTSLPMVAMMLACALVGLFFLGSGRAVVKHKARKAKSQTETKTATDPI